jgi:hypothetical protein
LSLLHIEEIKPASSSLWPIGSHSLIW